ncbi:hypothetical protein P6P90_09210 [Ectobacillus antri]|jgi:hypothetical protein|uniref:Uncharacterized protein n=1 Tax=Ectobacillus antri TaxID=2486280 RepID=A0ABT6H525_9BACI|nr:hypothetical protein [Ectobacillus antri]MDG4657048.1 hypothetical protein [Ectobacillus antri]MDG5754150.1 hypothetical protein [Ectobacillus antri]
MNNQQWMSEVLVDAYTSGPISQKQEQKQQINAKQQLKQQKIARDNR